MRKFDIKIRKFPVGLQYLKHCIDEDKKDTNFNIFNLRFT